MNLALRVSTHAPAAAWLGPPDDGRVRRRRPRRRRPRLDGRRALFDSRLAQRRRRRVGRARDERRAPRPPRRTPRTSAELEAALALPYTKGLTSRLEKALRCTLDEPGPAARWARPAVRAQVALACHFADFEHLVTSVLGGFVSADARRLEELVADTQDAADPLAVADCVLALSAGTGAGTA